MLIELERSLMIRYLLVICVSLVCAFSIPIGRVGASPSCQCPPMELEFKHSEGSPELRTSVLTLRNLGDVTVYFPLWEPNSASRVPLLHWGAYQIYTRNSNYTRELNMRGWVPILEAGSLPPWGGALVVNPGATVDLHIGIERVLQENDIPEAMVMVELISIATMCQVWSTAISVQDLAKLLPPSQ